MANINLDLNISSIRLEELAIQPSSIPSGYKNLYITSGGMFLIDSLGNISHIIYGNGTDLILDENVDVTGNFLLNSVDIFDVFLARDNTDVYIPSDPYNPATKKYVDDNISVGGSAYGIGSKQEWEYGLSDLESTMGGSWLPCEGGTIGNASSNGTARANADTDNLFTKIWNTHNTTTGTGNVSIYTSAGAPTTYGADATSDFTANKAIALPNLIGRTIVGVDVSSTVISGGIADEVGKTFGADVVTTTTAQMPQHNHTFETGPNNGAGSPGLRPAQTNTALSPSSYATANAGSGNSHNNMQPSYVSRFYICYAL